MEETIEDPFADSSAIVHAIEDAIEDAMRDDGIVRPQLSHGARSPTPRALAS